MSTISHNAQPDASPGSMQTSVSRPLPTSIPITSKRVCFYKSGDPQFMGHRMVINSRTFKTFDALLDALSKKVPLPFGVRTITTPKGTHAVRTLDDLQDGASYLCSDQRKVKPFNMDDINKRQVPWNTTRPISAGRQARRTLVRQLIKRSEVATRTAKMAENTVVVRTPKRLTVYKNRDPSVKRVVVLQRRTAPNFEALLNYLSQVMQFPVVKLYTAEGRRVEGLSALILCSGIVVAAGNESFRMANYNLQGPAKTTQTNISESMGPARTEPLQQEKKTPTGTLSRSRNFSLSSERYLVDQINKSLSGNLSEHNSQKSESMETEGSQRAVSEEMENCHCIAGMEEKNYPIMPSEDEIEKSFRVNEDGSMTVEMKVHLTLKQEELIHWTTTLSRTYSNSQQRAAYPSVHSLDVHNDPCKESNGLHSPESTEMNTLTHKTVGFNEEGREKYGSATPQTFEKPVHKRLPTPGPRQRRKEASVENIKRVSETEVQESTVGAYSYMERTAQGELTEGYCVVSRSSSSSTRTPSKPRKNESNEIKQKKTHSSLRSTGVADVLQLQNNGTIGITETVLHVYESQGTCDNYYANTQVDVDNKPGYCTKALPCSRPGSTDSGPRSSSNDCDVDLTRQSTSSNSRDGRKSDMLSLSSGHSTPPQKISNNLSLLADNEKEALVEGRSESTEIKIMHSGDAMEQESEDKSINGTKGKNTPKSKKSKKSTSSESSGPDKRIKGSIPGSSKDLRTINTSDTQSHTGSEQKTQSSAESDKHELKTRKDKNKKTKKLESSPKSRNLNVNTINQRGSETQLKLKDKTIKDVSHKVNSLRPTLQKSDIQSAAHPAPLKKMLPKQRSMNGNQAKLPKQKQELSESISLPILQSSPSSVNQYVENWLKKIQPESVPYDDDEMDHQENVPRAKFQIGSYSTDGSEVKGELEKGSVVDEGTALEDNAVERPVSRPPVQIRCEGEPVEVQRVRGFCKSMPSVRVFPAEQENLARMHKSSENLIPADSCTEGQSESTEVNVGSGMKPVLRQLCLSIQSIRRASSQTHLTPQEKEKSSSLPDFSSQVASAFGSPSRAFLSFLSLMTLRDGISHLNIDESQASNSGSCPEALQVMQSLEKIASIEDEEELKASLTSLQSSASSQLKQSWKDFQEKNVIGESPPLSPRLSEQEFALEVDSGGEGDDQDEKPDFGIEHLMDELNMSEDLRREISSLVEGEPSFIHTNGSKEHSDCTSEILRKEEENDGSTMGGSLEKAIDMEEEKSFFKEKTDQDDTTIDETINDSKVPECQELHLIQSHSSESDTVPQDIVNEDSDKVVYNQTPEEHCMENDSSTAEVLETTDSSQQNTEKRKERDEGSEPENRNAEQTHTLTSEQILPDTARQVVSELAEEHDNMSDKENSINLENVEESDVNAEEGRSIQNIREHTEQSDVISEISEHEDTDVKQACPASESEREEFPNRQAAELNEAHEIDQFGTAETEEDNCIREEAHSDFEENNEYEEVEHEQESKSVLSCENDVLSNHSVPSTESLSDNHNIQDKQREDSLESPYQHDDQVISPDQQDVLRPEMSECEDPEPHYNNNSHENGSNNQNGMTSQSECIEYVETKQIDNVEEQDSNDEDQEKSKVCELVDSGVEPEPVRISDPEAGNETEIKSRSNTSCDSELVCDVQALDKERLTDKKEGSVEECDEEKDEKCNTPSSDNDKDAEECDVEEDEECSELGSGNEKDAEERDVEDEECSEPNSGNDKDAEECDVEDEECCILDSGNEKDAEECDVENDEECSELNSGTDKDAEERDEEEDKEYCILDSGNDKDAEECNVEEDEKCTELGTGSDKDAEECDVEDEECCMLDSGNEKDAEECDVEDHEECSELNSDNDKDAEERDVEDEECCILDSGNDKESEECNVEEDEECCMLDSGNDKVAEGCDVEQDEECSELSSGNDKDAEECNVEQDEECSELSSGNDKDAEECDVEQDEECSELSSGNDKDAEECNVEQDEECSELSSGNDKDAEEHDVEEVEECCMLDSGNDKDAEEHNVEGDEVYSTLNSDNDKDAEELEIEQDKKCSTHGSGNDKDAEECDVLQDEECSELDFGNDKDAKERDVEQDEECSTLDSDNNKDPKECDLEKNEKFSLLHSGVNSFISKEVERGSWKNMKTQPNEQSEKGENLGMEHGYHYLLPTMEISQELLDLINSALLSSALTVTYDSNGNLRINQDKCKMREMSQHRDEQYGQKRLPSPNTSDLSDYRPETSDNDGHQSQESMEYLTESGDEEAHRFRIFQEIIKCRNHVKDNSSMKSYSGITKQTPSPSLKSTNSLASFQDSKSQIQEPPCYNRSGSSNGDSESVQCMALNRDVDSGEGVLIDKGRWLLKENHLIRKSPPVPMGMYGNGDTTSADTPQDDMSEDVPYPYAENQTSALAVLSSSELEEMTKPSTPKCSYFNMPHSSDSDPLMDAQSINGGNSRGNGRRTKELKVSPMGEPSKMWAKKNGSLSSFASVEFKLPDGKVHPQEGAAPCVVVNTHRSQSINSRTIQEEESREWLNLRCGQHCPIL